MRCPRRSAKGDRGTYPHPFRVIYFASGEITSVPTQMLPTNYPLLRAHYPRLRTRNRTTRRHRGNYTPSTKKHACAIEDTRVSTKKSLVPDPEPACPNRELACLSRGQARISAVPASRRG